MMSDEELRKLREDISRLTYNANLRNKTEFPLLVDKMTPDQIAKLEDRLRPGNHSELGSYSGFLAVEERLIDVIHKDSIALQKLGLTHKEVAEKLRALFFGRECRNYMGYQYCPWGDGANTDRDYVFNNPDIDHTQIIISDLLPHLIEAHNFFEGAVPYRISPEMILRIEKTRYK